MVRLFVEHSLLILGLVAAAPSPDGKQIVERGSATGAPPCSSCHGNNLQGNTAIKAPAIAGLPASKILERLAHYASPKGHNAAMRAVATALSPSEQIAVAKYISRLAFDSSGRAPSGTP
ncbi:c-type cytochrome [Sphingomonas sp. PAMC 26605]|uniref:c-type cytochrome n=1 Tax=Sphingomonas sp. PAMC 26605 TaxID=1112214 RepID=UPI003FA4B26E